MDNMHFLQNCSAHAVIYSTSLDLVSHKASIIRSDEILLYCSCISLLVWTFRLPLNWSRYEVLKLQSEWMENCPEWIGPVILFLSVKSNHQCKIMSVRLIWLQEMAKGCIATVAGFEGRLVNMQRIRRSDWHGDNSLNWSAMQLFPIRCWPFRACCFLTGAMVYFWEDLLASYSVFAVRQDFFTHRTQVLPAPRRRWIPSSMVIQREPKPQSLMNITPRPYRRRSGFNCR